MSIPLSARGSHGRARQGIHRKMINQHETENTTKKNTEIKKVPSQESEEMLLQQSAKDMWKGGAFS